MSIGNWRVPPWAPCEDVHAGLDDLAFRGDLVEARHHHLHVRTHAVAFKRECEAADERIVDARLEAGLALGDVARILVEKRSAHLSLAGARLTSEAASLSWEQCGQS